MYVPPQAARRRLPSLYVHDGAQYLHRVGLPRIAEHLVREGRIEPVILVFVDPVERFREYAREPAFTRFMVEEVVPFVDARYPTLRDPGRRGVMGASMGGLVSLHLAGAHPEVFGRAGSQSGAVDRLLDDPPGPRLPVYLDVGLYDLRHGNDSFLEANRAMARVLRGQGQPLCYTEYPGGHNWSSWRDTVPGLLEFLFPAAP